jgi:1-acyl-sn-glycerol-3-phosphate acyltransferase
MANIADQSIDTLDFELVRDEISKDNIVNYIAKTTQFLTWPFLYIIFHILFKIKISGQEVFKNINSPFIIIANHTSFYDSFLFRIILGLNTPHLPLRFMAVNSFESRAMNFVAATGLVDFMYSLFGVFTVTPGLGINKNLKKSKDIIYNGGNIVIYPEGRINHDETIGPFKNGASVLYKETGAEVVPVSIKKSKISILRPTITINIGQKIEISKSRSVDDITKQFRNTIVGLSQC